MQKPCYLAVDQCVWPTGLQQVGALEHVTWRANCHAADKAGVLALSGQVAAQEQPAHQRKIPTNPISVILKGMPSLN